MVFDRENHDSLVVTLTANEPLGILDTDFVEDYFGVDGQVTIYNTSSLVRTALVMVAVPGETPGTPDDIFRGQKLLSLLPDGDYEIQGRVRDVVGNHVILGDFQTPTGGETTLVLSFSIESGADITFYLGAISPTKLYLGSIEISTVYIGAIAI